MERNNMNEENLLYVLLFIVFLFLGLVIFSGII